MAEVAVRVVGLGAGEGVDPALAVLPQIELVKVSMGIPAAIGVSIGLAAGTINANGTVEQRKRWARDLMTFEKVGAWAITEPDAGSDAFGGMRTTVKPDRSTSSCSTARRRSSPTARTPTRSSSTPSSTTAPASTDATSRC